MKKSSAEKYDGMIEKSVFIEVQEITFCGKGNVLYFEWDIGSIYFKTHLTLYIT